MSIYLTVKNRESQETLISLPVAQSGTITSKGSWLFFQLRQVAIQETKKEGDFGEIFEVNTKSLKPLLQTDLDEDQQWIINHFIDEAEHLAVSVIN